jgi:hypothetical protein
MTRIEKIVYGAIVGMILALAFLAILPEFAQGQNTNAQCTKESETQTLSVSGNTLTFFDGCGAQTNQFELVIAGAPATFTGTLNGVLSGGNVTALASTAVTTASQVLSTAGGPYTKYTFTASWTGGASPSVTVNRLGATARHGAIQGTPFAQGGRPTVDSNQRIITTVATLDATVFKNNQPTLCPTAPVPLSADYAGSGQAAICAITTSAGGVVDMRGFDCSTAACNADSNPTEDPQTLKTTTKVIQLLIGRGQIYLGCVNGQQTCNHTDTVPIVWGVPTKSELLGEGPSKTTVTWNGPDPMTLTCHAAACPPAPVFCMGGGYEMSGDASHSDCTDPADDGFSNNPRILIRDVGLSCAGTLHVRGIQNETAQEQSGVQRYQINGCANGDVSNPAAGIYIIGADVQNSRGYIQGEIYYGAPGAGVPCSNGAGTAYGIFAQPGGGGMGVIIGDLTVNGSVCQPGSANIHNTAVYLDGLGEELYGIHIQGSKIGVDLCETANPCTSLFVHTISCTGTWDAVSQCVKIANCPHPCSVVVTGVMNGSTAASDSLFDGNLTAINAGSAFGQTPFSAGAGGGSFAQYSGGGGSINGTEMHNIQGLAFTEQPPLTCPASGEQLYAENTHALRACYNGGGPFRLPIVIFNSTSGALTTAAIGAGACGTTVTVAAAGVVATDSVSFSLNAAPAGTNAGLVAWPTAGNVNFAYCPGVAETPAAATANFRVTR